MSRGIFKIIVRKIVYNKHVLDQLMLYILSVDVKKYLDLQICFLYVTSHKTTQ
jgi:hypothetical protein